MPSRLRKFLILRPPKPRDPIELARLFLSACAILVIPWLGFRIDKQLVDSEKFDRVRTLVLESADRPAPPALTAAVSALVSGTEQQQLAALTVLSAVSPEYASRIGYTVYLSQTFPEPVRNHALKIAYDSEIRVLEDRFDRNLRAATMYRRGDFLCDAAQEFSAAWNTIPQSYDITQEADTHAQEAWSHLRRGDCESAADEFSEAFRLRILRLQ
jgi:hypothetical protein